MIAGVGQDSLERFAPVVQLTSAPVSPDCKQVNRLTLATALVRDHLAIRFLERAVSRNQSLSKVIDDMGGPVRTKRRRKRTGRRKMCGTVRALARIEKEI
jgi:hypothetical protein